MTTLPEKEISTNRDNSSIQASDITETGNQETQNINQTQADDSTVKEEDQQQRTPNQNETLTKTTTTRGEKPYISFSRGQKWFIVGMASAASFFSPLSGQIYFPVLPILTQSYHLSQTLLNVSVTTYLIFQGLAPSFMGTFSDASGRRPAYILAFIIYTAANIGLALQNSYAALLVLRCLQSAGSSGTVSFGYGVIADITTTAERGKFLGPMAAGAMVGPALGPVIGGLLAQYLGWRSVFWFLVIISGSYLAVYTILTPETHRKIVGDGSILPSESWRLSILQYVRIRRKLARMTPEEKQEYGEEQAALTAQQKSRKIKFPNPLLSFVILLEKDAFVIILYAAIMFFGMMIMMTSLPSLFPEYYGLDELQVGLCFLPFGISTAIGAVINGKFLDLNYKRLARKLGMSVDRKRGDDLTNFPIEKARLQLSFLWSSILAATMLGYGWALNYKAPLAVPLVIMFIMGFTMICTMNSLTTLLTDIFPDRVSTASAAQNLLRCLLGAVGAAVVDQMLKSMGIGWCFTFMGLLILAATGLLWFEYIWGMEWRQKRWKKAAEKAKRERQNGTV
ncbi:MFS transporter, putative [Talaromyces stipitatus ATCC 10500]|uniref:MFS transporter, putative n=1 Tax=Talaromyces stipitatus (strain ATCC 10500 / CBS 375.48 / QM 6759 / NRRL 1006) TaxID=441959 RepID=B8LWK5_TALSN|nr:MFS transporter, putative [Talaromyces stipitatus ATCC 10500]EED24402.1 MFS transporter, putative [Talaromyces stipitatus ATCC 10500]